MRATLCAFLVICASATAAAPYPLGTMSCDDIGAFASEAMGWRKSGVPKNVALERLEARSYGDPVEKNNLTVIVGLVYGSYGNNWSVESAGGVMRSDCLQGREQR